MKSALINLITALVRRLVGSDLWSLISIAVAQADTTEATGTEKRTQVYTAAKAMFSNAAGWMLGLAIEAAVARLRTQK